LNFTAIDFETANGSQASVCAVGLVRVRDGKIVETYSSLIQPPPGHDEFNEFNVRIHGIQMIDVVDAPPVRDALPAMFDFIGDDVLIAHNAQFDMGVLAAAARVVGFELPSVQYACSLEMARKSYELESYRLPNVALAAGHDEFNHHDALADAEACALIVMHMARHKHHVVDLPGLLDATSKKLKAL
jgi:DNA polymerase-3 subunit epsilon